MTMRRVYVIELSDDIGTRNNGDYPHVYVGETGLSPEERFEVHKAGGRTSSSKVRNFGLRLRPDLYHHLPPYLTEAESVEAEKALRSQLEQIGYTVWGGTKGLHESFSEAHTPTS